MKIKLANVFGLAVLVASFACGSSFVYADAEETSSIIEALTPAATSDEGGLSCFLDSAGADICTIATKIAELDQPATAGETELTAAEEAPAIHFVDAIVAVVHETVTIAAPGEGAANADVAGTGSSEQPAAEPVAMLDAGTPVPSPTPAIGTVDAIVAEVTQTATIAAPGQDPGDSKDPAYTGSIAVPPVAEPAPAIDTNDLED
jgi:hypothetical protein